MEMGGFSEWFRLQTSKSSIRFPIQNALSKVWHDGYNDTLLYFFFIER